MRKPSPREGLLLAALSVGLLFVGIRLFRHSDADFPQRGARAGLGQLPDIPRIGLERLDAQPSGGEAGRRDLFKFGFVEEQRPRPAPVVVMTPPPAPLVPPGMTVNADGILTPSLPPLNVRYIGSVENSHGVKVAVLVTDRREVLTGQSGQVIANRYRIARIGLESIDLEDVSSGQSRRVPLKGD